MLALRIPADLEKRLDKLAAKSGRSKSAIARDALVAQIEEMEDIALAEERLREAGETIGWNEVKARLFALTGK